MQTPAPAGSDKKVVAGLLGILLGYFGIHKFVLGYTQEGMIMLFSTLGGAVVGGCCCLPIVMAPLAMGVIGLAEGIIYLTKSDQEFVDTYITGKKAWF